MIRLLSPIIYIICIGDVIRTGFLLPYGRDREFTVCLCLCAVINLALSACFIPFIGIYGAIVGTLSAELFGLVYQAVLCKRSLRFSVFLKPLIAVGVIGAAMFGEISFLNTLWDYGVKTLICKILIGGATASALTLCYLAVFERDYIRTLKPKKSR